MISTIVNNTKDIVFIKDCNFKYIAASEGFLKMTGAERQEDILGKTDFEIFEEKSLAERYRKDDEELFRTEQSIIDYVEPTPDINGEISYACTNKYIIYGENNEKLGILCIARDVTWEYKTKLNYEHIFQNFFKLSDHTLADRKSVV